MVRALHQFLAIAALSLLSTDPARAAVLGVRQRTSAAQVACSKIRQLKTTPAVAFANQEQYVDDVSHWSNASSLISACSVEPENVKEIQQILSIIGQTRAPFAVKGVGHCNNNNMSSTIGVQIAMSKFTDIKVHQANQTVEIGMGLNWGTVWKALDPYNLMVVGGRAGSVGVGGLILSGGYSWKTNEYGFASDNVVSWDLVTPEGDFVKVTQETQPDLFFALQGGVNNFGVVTSVTVQAHDQGKVWGGIVSVPGDTSAATEAIAKFAKENTDPKAVVATIFAAAGGQVSSTIIVFYDAPSPPQGLLDEFLSLPNATSDLATRSFLEFTNTISIGTTSNNRATWHSAPILEWPTELIEYITEQMVVFSGKLAERSGVSITANVEPFLPQAYGFNRGAAFPHSQSTPYNTFNGLVTWSDPADDAFAFNLTRQYHEAIWQKAIELGVSSPDAKFPPNYAISGTPVEAIYGENLARLRKIKGSIDPRSIFDLTGGWKI